MVKILHSSNRSVALYLLIILFFCALTVNGQVSQVEFGKNRVQYNDDFEEWIYFESPNFVTYFYGKSRQIGYKTLQYAEKDLEDLLRILEYKINDKLDILVFSEMNDIKQSNIGISESFVIERKKVKVEGNRIFVYYDGDLNHLRTQVREGITDAFIQNMFYGAEWKEALKGHNSQLLPLWFVDGLVAYAGQKWSVEDDAEARDVFNNKKYKNYNKWVTTNPRLAGKAFWKYIADLYGENEIPNILYVARINKSVESGLLYILGKSYEEEVNDMWSYYNIYYSKDSIGRQRINPQNSKVYRSQKNYQITQLKSSTDGSMAAMVLNHLDKNFVRIIEKSTHKIKKIIRVGHRNNIQEEDIQQPSIAWSKDNKRLGIIYSKRDEWWYLEYNIGDQKRTKPLKLPQKIQRVFGFDMDGTKGLVISALGEMSTDLYYYQFKNNSFEQITNDLYDDVDPIIVNIAGTKGIVFCSNRNGNSLEKVQPIPTLIGSDFDMYFYQWDAKWNTLQRLTETPSFRESNPEMLNGEELTWISDETGIRSVAKCNISISSKLKYSRILLRDGTYKTIEDGQTMPNQKDIEKEEKLAIVRLSTADKNVSNTNSSIKHNSGGYIVLAKDDRNFIIPSDILTFETPNLSLNTNYRKDLQEGQIAPKQVNKSRAVESKIDKSYHIQEYSDTLHELNPNHFFQTQFESVELVRSGIPFFPEAKADTIKSLADPEENDESVVFPNGLYKIDPFKVIPYRLNFRLLDFNTTLDNNPLFGGLNSFVSSPDQFNTPPLGILAKAKWKDLLENYIFEGGVRVPTSFNGSEIFLTFDDLKRRFDHQFAIYRKTITEAAGGFGFIAYRVKSIALLGQYTVKYAFDVHQSIKATTTLRQDRQVSQSSDNITLDNSDKINQRIAEQLTYIYDNSVDKDINIKYGTRAKVYMEFIKPLSINFADLSVKANKGYTAILGIDARHYIKLDKHSILAIRVAGAHSFGNDLVLHYIGGTDNWVLPSFSKNIPNPVDVNLAYQVLAPNLRGFQYNVRNGTTYGIINSEVRVPIIKYLSQRPLKSAFLRSIQAVGFLDAGTAWTGAPPFNNNNPSNSIVIENPTSIFVKVNYYRNPIVLGYGFGFRANIFGYFMRADYAWGLETSRLNPPILHLSMGLDF